MHGDFLDVILIVLAAAFAVAGYRQGFIIGLLSFAGFIAGASMGAYLAPGLSRAMSKAANLQAFLAIVIVFVAAVGGMLLASAVGVALRSRIRQGPATVADSVGGAVVNVVALLLLAWTVGSLIAYSPFPGIAGQVNNSLVLRTVDRLIPASARPEFSSLRRLLTQGPYTQVFGALGAETALNVSAPNPAVLRSQGLARARASIVKVEGVAPSCGHKIEGSGFVVAPGKVVTNAHVVAGVTQGPAVFTVAGSEYPARVVLFDPRRDIAVLDVPGLNAPALPLAGQARSGASAIVAGYPEDHPFSAVAARVGAAEQAAGPDIYSNAQVVRQIYPIRAVVQPGNSGGPLLSPAGQVYGVVFAAATSIPDTGYALTAQEIAPDVRQGITDNVAVSTQSCS